MVSFIIVFTLLLEKLFFDVSILSISFMAGTVLIVAGVMVIMKVSNHSEKIKNNRTKEEINLS
jgi:hypothetical protein